MGNYDRDILKALRGNTRDSPANLADIIALVDARQRLLLTHDELESGLRRLIAAGRAAEAKPLHFFPTPAPLELRPFSGVTADEYRDGVKAYHQRIEESEDLPADEDPGGPLVVVRWQAQDGKDITNEDEDGAEELADRLEPILPAVAQAEIMGFETGRDSIDILIWGIGGTDDDADQIYDAVVDTFRAFGCPAGSAIIRYYNAGENELESDVQPGSPTKASQ